MGFPIWGSNARLKMHGLIVTLVLRSLAQSGSAYGSRSQPPPQFTNDFATAICSAGFSHHVDRASSTTVPSTGHYKDEFCDGDELSCKSRKAITVRARRQLSTSKRLGELRQPLAIGEARHSCTNCLIEIIAKVQGDWLFFFVVRSVAVHRAIAARR